MPGTLQEVEEEEPMKQLVALLAVAAIVAYGAETKALAKRDLLKELKSDDEAVRAEAALLLKSNPKAVPALIDRLENDPSDEVRLWAAFALGELGQKSAVPALLKYLATQPEAAERVYYVAGRKAAHGGDIVRRNVCWALGPIGDLRALEPLLKEAKAAKDWEVRYYAISSLAKLGSPRALPVLEDIAKSDPHKRDWEDTYLVREQAKKAIDAIKKKAK